MKAGDLLAITKTAKLCPDSLALIIMIYQMGYKQGIIDKLKKELK